AARDGRGAAALPRARISADSAVSAQSGAGRELLGARAVNRVGSCVRSCAHLRGHTGCSEWRRMRALALLAIVGCMEAAQPAAPGPQSCSFRGFYDMGVNAKLDILFVIDDSSAMAPYQAALEENAPIFMNVLMSLPYAPNVRIAVARASDGSFVDPAPCGVQS